MNKRPLLFVIALFFSLTAFTQSAVLTGEMKKFHKVTLTWQSEDFIEEEATFKDYRLNVTFLSPTGLTYVVPGYYAADGNAAESSATSGNKWRCHFNPLEIGTWSYSTSFRTADDIAISFDPFAGNAVPSIDGDNGTFDIIETDKSGIDFRSKGKLEYVGEHYLKWTNGEYFLKLGTNSPEVLLEYVDFDNSPVNTNFSTLIPRDYQSHVPDWNQGDPIWQTNKGKGIIGAINYLSNQGVNAHYFLTDSSYGDTDTVFPWVSIDEHYVYDTSKLDQWQIVFDHMMSKGIKVHFVISEAEQQSLFELFSDFEGDDPTFANARKIYYRELVARFGYLNAITWNLGEENGWDRPNETYGRALTAQQQIAFADYIKQLIYYDDHITLQNGHANDDSIFEDLIGDNQLSGASLQGVAWNTQRSRTSVINWREKSALSGRKWIVNYDEAYDSGDLNDLEFRQNSLWASLTAGAAGFEFYTPDRDWRVQNYRDYEEYWTYMRYANQFFADNNIPFHEMESKDQMVSNGWSFGKDYEVYVIYIPTQGTTTAQITGEYSVKWFDPRNGGNLVDGSVTSVSGGNNVNLGAPPNNPDLDWVVLLQTTQTGTIDVNGISVSPATLTIGDQQTYQLSANVLPRNADNTEFTWSSNNSAIASVDTNGQVTAHAVGDVSIMVTSDEGNFTDSTLITVLDSSNFCNATGTILMERYDGIAGSDLNSLFNAPTYPNNPTVSVELDKFEIPINATDEYGTRLSGYLCAPEDGIYYFWVAGDDHSQLNISADTDPLNSTTIAFHNSWTNSRDWLKFSSQKSVGIELKVGQTYYLEAIMKEGGGGDNLAVGWRKPSNGNANIPFEVIPGTFLSPSLPAPVKVDGVVLNPNSVSIETGATSQLTATISPSDADNLLVSWSSDNTNIATVDTSGVVTAISPGTANVTVTTDDGNFTASSLITVTAAPIRVTGVVLNPNSVSLETGETSQLTVTISPSDANNLSVVWSSDNPNIATVDTNGNVTAVSPGTASITVITVDGNFTATSLITVITAPISVTGVVLNPNSVSLEAGETSQLTATISPSDANNLSVVWSSDNPNITTVDTNGNVTAVSPGTASITVTTIDGDFTATSLITVTTAPIRVTGVVLNPNSISLEAGSTSELTATVSPSNADNLLVSWSSDNVSITTVDTNGIVTAISHGTANITVTTEDGNYTATAAISVTANPVPVTGVEVDPNSASLETGETLQLNATVTPSEADNHSISWSSSNTNVATVDSSGLITALTEGTTTISAITEEGGYSATISISVENLKVMPEISTMIYPNPAYDMVLINFSEAQSATTVQVHDTHGRLILNLDREDFEVQNNSIEFSVLQLKDAIYFVRVINVSMELFEFRLIIKK
ncbi:MAG: Ig-like domain-containing protein [Maribacter sp.]